MLTRTRHRRFLLALVAAIAFTGCGQFASRADQAFGDQHFKTAIAHVELHRLRHGTYPRTLQELEFVGEWDRAALVSVEYERLSDGYALTLVRGWVGMPALEYPPAFWKGLGIRRTNVKGLVAEGGSSADR